MGTRSRWSIVALLLATASVARAAPITWVGGDATWIDGAGNNANWNPADEPDPDDTAIFNTDNLIKLGSSNTVVGLTMSASATLDLATFALTVNGPTTLSGAGTRLEVTGPTATLGAADLTINNGGTVFVDGGAVTSGIAGATNATVTVNAGGTLTGNGTLSLTDGFGAVTTALNNNGTLGASNPSSFVFVAPTPATFAISASDVDARIDLDGTGEAGAVVVSRNQTLDVNVPLADIFNGSMTLTHNATLDVSSAWILGAGAAVSVNNGATGGIGGIPAGVSTIAGSSFSQNSGTITVADGDGTLRFDAPFSMNGGDLVNNGLVVFNATTVVGAAANFTMPAATSGLTVAANRSATINQNNFNLDGANALTNVLTVEAGGTLTVSTTDYDPDSATNAFNGTINLNNGDISVNTADASFVMAGRLNMLSNVAGQITAWSGEPVIIGNDAGALDSKLTVAGTEQAQFGPTVSFSADADVNVASGATLALLGTANFNTVNGANNASFTGAGRIVFSGPVNVNEAVTLNMPGGTVDLDGLDSIGDFVNVDAPLTINAATMASFGRVNGGGGVNTLDINNNVGTGVLTVNLDGASAEWTLNAAGVMNLVNDAGGGTLLAGADVNLAGTVNVTGGVVTSARIDLSGNVNVNAASALTLQGGSLADPNRLEGGTVNGPGSISASTGRALRGFGTVNTGVNFVGAAELLADDGELVVSGSILDAGKVGTADADGTLNVVNAWNTVVVDNVSLAGGTLKGGLVTVGNANGIQGHGTVSARVNNTTKIVATGGALVVQTAANDNDWDGGANTGQLEALGGDLELRDNATFGIGGTVRASNGHRVFANGFALDFNPGSALVLSGARYESNRSTDIGGTVTVSGATSTIQVENNFFLTFESGSTTTLNANLRLLNNNINVEQGATFSGSGAVVIPDGSHMVADNLSNIGVLLQMDGAFRPGNSQGIGRVQMLDFQGSATAELYVELIGTGLNQFDRLVVDGDAVVDGFLSLDIDDVSPGVPFVPALGQTFNIITANTVTGTFDFKDISGMPAGLTFAVKYLSNAVQLQVVTKPIFSADFDDDGDVDDTDLAIWRNAFNLNQLGDADGDNDSDLADWTLWREQYGSQPTPFGGVASDVAPEPGAALGLLGAACAALRRRVRRRAPIACAVAVTALPALAALPATASAAPTISVQDNGIVGGTNREWIVRITPDAALIAANHKAVATEVGFAIASGAILSATKNMASWPYDLPGITPPTYPALTPSGGIAISGGKLFASLGSNLFNSATPVELMRIVTQGTVSTTFTWGDYTVSGRVKGLRIAQGGQLFDGQFGSLLSALNGDFDLDGALDADDMNQLYAAAQGAVPPALAKFDVSGNSNVNSAPNTANSDADVWVRMLKGTEYGDANLDRAVNFNDLLALAQNYGLPAAGWAQGNFDGVPGVGFGDLLLLAQNYGQTFSGSFEGDWSLAQAVVPEPMSGAGAAVASGFALSRRRRRVT